MNKARKFIRLGATMLLPLLSYLFFRLRFQGFLYIEEEYQIFLFDKSFISEFLSCPGGFASLLSRFFVQLFQFAPLGALLYALSYFLIQQLTYSISNRQGSLSFALSFVPASVMWIANLFDTTLFCTNVSFILVLAALLIVNKISNVTARNMIFTLSVPVVYYLCGPLALCMILSAFFMENRPSVIPVAAGALLAGAVHLCFCVYAAYPAYAICRGLFYYRIQYLFPANLLLLTISVPLILVLSKYIRLRTIILPLATILLQYACIAFFCMRVPDYAMNDVMVLHHLVHRNEWDKVVSTFKSQKRPRGTCTFKKLGDHYAWQFSPKYVYPMSCLYLAYAEKGELLDSLYTTLSPGPGGLMPIYSKYNEAIFIADICYNLDLINEAQRYYFEAKEGVHDYQKSAYLYKQLALTNSVNGNFAASEKYLNALSKTLTYRRFAIGFDHNSDEMVQKRRFRDNTHRGVISYGRLVESLWKLLEQCPDNYMVYQYLMASILMNKNLEMLRAALDAFGLPPERDIPLYLQQGIALYASKTGDFDYPLFTGLGDDVKIKFNDFYTDYLKLDMSSPGYPSDVQSMRRKYGDTYYFYFLLQ